MAERKNIRIYTLFSGSSGNSAYLDCAGTEILIDAGASARAIEGSLSGLGSSLANIRAIFITHEHVDHIKGLGTISKKYKIPIYAEKKCSERLAGIDAGLVNILPPDGEASVGAVTVKSFRTFHDSTSSCGYVVSFEGHSFGYATDTGRLSEDIYNSLAPCDAAILEANYDKDMLFSGSYPHFLKLRIDSDTGHLDNSQCALLCSFLASHNTKRVLLSHLSAENNTPQAALAAVERQLARDSCQLSVDIAQRYSPTELVNIYV